MCGIRQIRIAEARDDLFHPKHFSKRQCFNRKPDRKNEIVSSALKFEIRSSLFHKIFLFIFIERLIRPDICRWIRKREKTNALCSVPDTIAMECTWNVIQYTTRRWARRNRSARSVIDSELLHTTFVRAPIQSSYDGKLYIGVIQRGERSITLVASRATCVLLRSVYLIIKSKQARLAVSEIVLTLFQRRVD